MMRLVLASASVSRRRILAEAGVLFAVCPAPVDEAAIKGARGAEGVPPGTLAAELALTKAQSVAREYPGAAILGADQVLVCEGRMFDKAASLEEARAILMALRGKEHQLVTALALVRDAEILWRYTETVRLWMREFSDDFLDAYLVEEARDILSSVGCYHVEGRGVQLFDRIEGDHFAARGLPLIPLLNVLRQLGVLPS
jgi:septum formation protein